MAAELPRTPYHIGPQQADALLGPVRLEVETLVARLTQYHERLHMPDADRATIGEARDAVAQAAARLRELG